MRNGDLFVCSGNGNIKLAKDICNILDVPLGQMAVTRFSDGEIQVQIDENVRGKDVFVVQPTCPPANETLMELLVIADALKRSSAKRVTAVVPYYGYARQDRKDRPRVPITAKLVADLMTVAGINRVVTIDLHAQQIQGFFNIPFDHLYAVNVLINYFEANKVDDVVVVSTDVGGVKMARAYAKRMHADFAIVDKRRITDKETEVMNIIGNVEGKNVIIVDDMVATAGSLCEAVEALKKNGAKDVYAAATHPVLSGPAIERIKKSSLKKLLVTDTIIVPPEKKCDVIEVLTIAPLLAEAIERIHKEESISILFDEE